VVQYDIRDLGPYFWPAGVTDTGRVIGIRREGVGGGVKHISLIADDAVRDVGSLAGARSSISAVNADGWLTGQIDVDGEHLHAFRHADGRLADLGALHGDDSYGKDINDRGCVVGWSSVPARPASPAWDDPGPRAALFDGVAMRDLGTLGGPCSFARGINNADHIVGMAMVTDGEYRAFLFDAAGMRDLAGLTGEPAFNAWAINDAGQVAGTVRERAALWQGGTLIDLGTRAGRRGIPLSINDRGAVLGVQYRLGTRPGSQGQLGLPGFLWHDGVMRDLDELLPPHVGWGRLSSRAINNLGQIVGRGEYLGQQHGFLLTPM